MKNATLYICSLLLVLSFAAASASAQTVVHISMSNLTFVGATVCGGGSAACTETANISFDWDVTTGSIVSGSMSTVVSGAIAGPYNFANTGPVVGGQGFLWTDANGDSVSVNTCGFDCGKFPSVGVYNTIDVTLLCGSAGDTCFTDGFHGAHPTSGTFTISTASFTLQASPSSQTVFASGSTSFLVSIVPINGFSGQVIVRLTSILPATSSISTLGSLAAAENGMPATLEIHTLPDIPPATYTLVLTGTSGQETDSHILTLNVQSGITQVQNIINLNSYSESISSSSVPCPELICFSIQQNVEIDDPKSTQGFSFWAQNVILIEQNALGQTTARAAFQLFKSSDLTHPTECSPNILGTCVPLLSELSPFPAIVGLPTSLKMVTNINSANQLVMTNPFGVYTFTQTPMPTGAFINIGYNSNATTCNQTATPLLTPELIIVGPSSGQANFFPGTDGSVESLAGTASLGPVTLVPHQHCDSVSSETSSGLQWDFTGANTSSFGRSGLLAEGIGFVPSTPVAQVSMQGGDASVDQVSSTGVNVSISGSTDSNGNPLSGTSVTVVTSNVGSTQPPGTGQVNLGAAGFYDVKIIGILNGTATVCISNPSVSPQTVMQYWDATLKNWVNAGGQPGFRSNPPNTVCGSMPVAALSGTPIAVGPLSNSQAQVDLDTKVRSVTLEREKDRYLVTLTVTNNGSLTADDASVTLAELNGTPTSTTLPNTLGSLSYAASATFTLGFPRRAVEEEDFGYLRIVETYTGGSADQVLRVKLPHRGESEDDDKDREHQDRDDPQDDYK